MTKKPQVKKLATKKLQVQEPRAKKLEVQKLDAFETMENGKLYETRCGMVHDAIVHGVYLEDLKTQGLLEGERDKMIRCCRILGERLSRCASTKAVTESRIGAIQLSLPLAMATRTRSGGRS